MRFNIFVKGPVLMVYFRLIRKSGLKIFAFDDLDEAAEQAVQAAH